MVEVYGCVFTHDEGRRENLSIEDINKLLNDDSPCYWIEYKTLEPLEDGRYVIREHVFFTAGETDEEARYYFFRYSKDHPRIMLYFPRRIVPREKLGRELRGWYYKLERKMDENKIVSFSADGLHFVKAKDQKFGIKYDR